MNLHLHRNCKRKMLVSLNAMSKRASLMQTENKALLVLKKQKISSDIIESDHREGEAHAGDIGIFVRQEKKRLMISNNYIVDKNCDLLLKHSRT